MLKSERDNSQLTDAEIREIFAYNNAPVFDPLIDFQQNYGGFIFYAGLTPIKFSLLKGEGGYPKSGKTSIIEFEESRTSSPKYFFDYAATLYQMQFFLDENGVYYEDYEAKPSSFDKTVEHLSLWDEMRNRKDFELLFRDRVLSSNQLNKDLKLDLLAEASDQYTRWFRNEHIYMKQWKGLTTRIVSNSYPGKAELLAL